MFIRIINSIEDVSIPKEECPNGLSITVRSGSGKNGEGKFGGTGGYGEEKNKIIKEFNNLSISVRFENNAKDGESSHMTVDCGDTSGRENLGGKCGSDVFLLINKDSTTESIICRGGGGGGGSGGECIADTSFGPLKIMLESGEGGSNWENKPTFHKTGLHGGDGINGAETNNPYRGNAEVVVSSL